MFFYNDVCITLSRKAERFLQASTKLFLKMERNNIILKVKYYPDFSYIYSKIFINCLLVGLCVNCRKKANHTLLSRKKFQEAFSLNICESCMLKMSGITSLRGNGDRIWDTFMSSPKNLVMNLITRALDPEKDNLQNKAINILKYHVLRAGKKRLIVCIIFSYLLLLLNLIF